MKIKLGLSTGINVGKFGLSKPAGPSDTTAPTCVITSASSGAVAGVFTVTITFSEAVVGFDASKITVTNGSAGATSGSGPYTSVITPTAFGTVTVQVEASKVTDAAGNNNTASNTISLLYMTPAAWFDFSTTTGLYQTNDTSTPVTADGQSIGYVTDKSGNTKHATQGTAGNMPTWKASIKNGLGVGRMDNTNDVLSFSYPLGAATDFTVCIVFKITALQDYTSIYGRLASTWDRHPAMHSGADGSVYTGVSTSARISTSAGYIANGNYYILTLKKSGTSSGNLALYKNSGTATVNTGKTETNPLSDTVAIGQTGGVQPMNGDVCEYIEFASALDDTTRGLVESYLNAKWTIF